MDKYQRVIDITTNPEKYSDRELKEILRDPETREIYDILCDADSSLKRSPEISAEETDAEWERLVNHKTKRRLFIGFTSRRVAVIAAIAVTSIAALAIGIGIGSRRSDNSASESKTTSHIENKTAVASLSADTITAKDSTVNRQLPVVYENAQLRVILTDLSRHYGLRLDTLNIAPLKLRLYYKWDPENSVNEVIGQLNNFEKINLVLSEETLKLQ